ncbi:alpha/beta fold hydrolase [Actinokineospora sp.]|uniref:alpha/beta fold hydrolase n=1 Tax=Actinokineospora sp. TaxID=1872133 RepID=UPI003D6BFE07
MSDEFAQTGGVRLCYRTRGDRGADPLLLIAGLGQDLTVWPEEFLDGLASRGFLVVHHDNRDAGRSSRIGTPPPNTARKLLARPRHDAYTLRDMADDALGLLDHLGIGGAHLVGMSMGGMIAQTLAACYPARVRTLTSVFSTTGERRVGQPARSTILRLARRPARTQDEAVRAHLDITAHLAGRDYPLDETVESAYARRVWERAGGRSSAAGTARQIQAIHASGDRTDELRRITTATLVVHGDRDLIVHPSGGRATADAIPGARHVAIAGMGHHLAPGLVPRLVDLVAEHCAQGVRP